MQCLSFSQQRKLFWICSTLDKLAGFHLFTFFYSKRFGWLESRNPRRGGIGLLSSSVCRGCRARGRTWARAARWQATATCSGWVARWHAQAQAQAQHIGERDGDCAVHAMMQCNSCIVPYVRNYYKYKPLAVRNKMADWQHAAQHERCTHWRTPSILYWRRRDDLVRIYVSMRRPSFTCTCTVRVRACCRRVLRDRVYRRKESTYNY